MQPSTAAGDQDTGIGQFVLSVLPDLGYQHLPGIARDSSHGASVRPELHPASQIVVADGAVADLGRE